MRKTLGWSLIVVLLFSYISISPSSAAVRARAICVKAGAKANYGGKRYICVKSGKQLVWSKGVVLPTPSPTPSSASTDTPSPSPTPTHTFTPLALPTPICVNAPASTSHLPFWGQLAPDNMASQWTSFSDVYTTWCPASAINGGTIIYTVTASPGGMTCTSTTTSCSISGLDSNSPYSLYLMATNLNGSSNSGASVPSSGEIFSCIPDEIKCFYGPNNLTFSDYGNVAPTNLGDCTFAAVAYWQQIVLGKTMNQTRLGFEFSQAGGTEQDGLTPDQLFNYWFSYGINGVKLASTNKYYFDQIDVQNGVLDYKALLAFLHFQDGSSIGPYPMTAGNHAVVVDGFTPQGPLVVTWGQTLQMTWQQWNTEVYDMYGMVT